MNKVLYLAIVAAVATLSACSSTPNCLKDQPYMQAKQFPPLKSPPGLQVPKPDADNQIPSVANGPVGAYAQAPKGTDSNNEYNRCLTTPPPIATS
ncbi:MAG: hypothetical protein PF501_10745 [Salinisphaera sp.]|nr:hypothetical protein [Salinisphaera sp.]